MAAFTPGKDFLVGKCDEGFVVVNIRLEPRPGGMTVEHEQVERVEEFAASGSVWRRRNSNDCHMAGQMLDVLMEPSMRPMGSWTFTDLMSLWALWKRWHLNTMKAGCAHQQVRWEYTLGYERPDLANTPACPISGYKYGSGWLVEPLPMRVHDEAHRLATLLGRSEEWQA